MKLMKGMEGCIQTVQISARVQSLLFSTSKPLWKAQSQEQIRHLSES